MRSSIIRLFWVLGLWLFSTAGLSETTPTQPSVNSGKLDLSGWQSVQKPSLRLSGLWFWQAEQQLLAGNIGPTKPSLQTVPVSDYNSPANKAPLANYWLTITPPANQQNLGLLIHRTCSSARVYLHPITAHSTQPIAILGKTGAKGASSPYAGSQVIPLPFQSTAAHRLLIQTSNHDFWGSGLCGDIRIGDLSTLHKETTASTMKVAMPTAMLAMAAIYSIAIYAQRPQDKAPLWLALSCCSTAMFFFMYNGLLEIFIDSQARWLFELRYRIQFISCSLVPPIMMMFYSCSFPGYLNPLWLRTNLLFTLLSCVLIALTPTATIWSVIFFAITYWALQFLAGVWVLFKAVNDKQPYAKAMLIAVLPITIIVPLELLGRSYVGSPPTLSLYALLFFIFIESQIVGRKFSSAFNLAERLSTNLREEVALQTAELHSQNRRLERAQQSLKNANSALTKLSITDGLTGIYNRSYFEQEFYKEWRRSTRQKTPLSILMLDADHFKRLNDSAGHKVGDLCLQAISEQLNQHFKRAGEMVARYGGEEFVALLPETNQRKALAVAEGLRSAIEKLLIKHKNESYKVTISIGVSTTIPTTNNTPDSLLEAADAALYEAKARGRNQTAIIPLLANQTQVEPQRRLL